ncbi:hypothetical protein NDU88_005299 [Pleurodeles waltl]|uniref:Secreted protein n=1 Tax=Pleurodeles waltl TaxID=8319 RepID=A0AAV7L0C6_PLEWA|nr:hypothetical protein NDU88_005299 [Pleurodeles waltl]
MRLRAASAARAAFVTDGREESLGADVRLWCCWCAPSGPAGSHFRSSVDAGLFPVTGRSFPVRGRLVFLWGWGGPCFSGRAVLLTNRRACREEQQQRLY